MPSLSLCMIVKNEADRIDACLLSACQYVDEIIVVDTGSTDDTKKCCPEYGAKVFDMTPETHPESFFRDQKGSCPPPHSGLWALGDFAAARNFSFSLATGDFILWLDADDVLEGGDLLRGLVNSMNARGQTTAIMTYDYSHDSSGRVTTKLLRERIIKRGTAKWVGRVHEFLDGVDRTKARVISDIKVVHNWRLHEGEIVRRNYKILMREVEKNPDPDARTLFYLGNEARFFDPERAIWAYDRYVRKSRSLEERSLAHVRLGELYETKDLHLAKKEYAVAAVETNIPEGWFGLARVAYLRAIKSNDAADWHDCVIYTERGFTSSKSAPDAILHHPLDRLQLPHVFYNRALYNVGRVKEALESCEEGLKHGPEIHLLENRAFYDALLHPTMHQRITILPKQLEIVIWTGPAIEKWGPRSPLESGIGGAETACVAMARELAKLGHKVFVYADCENVSESRDGVTYVSYRLLTDPIVCDVFIASRQPGAIVKVKAKASFLWMHDAHIGNEPGMLCYDRVLALSQRHKDFLLEKYPKLKGRLLVTRNGIDPARFGGDLPKKNRLIYSSSATRGLGQLLDMMPEICARVPDAELHVFYGFEASRKQAAMSDQHLLLWHCLEACELKAKEMPGVWLHGRVGQQRLATAMMGAKVWAYPTDWQETSCIGAMEAQAAGCVPVATNLAALAETVQHGVLIEGPNTSPEYRRRFIDEVCCLLEDEGWRQNFATIGREWALENLSWSSLAVEWEEMFRQVAHG